MRYLALCCDYDGTIAHHGEVYQPTIAALERLIASGRKLLLVTGRELDDLHRVCPRLDLFERVVAENGALLYTPATREEKPLADAPPPQLVQRLRERGVDPLSVGRCIVATWEPYDGVVLETIRDLGLELQVIFNKGAVMVLPSGVNKATGLQAALSSMGLSPRNAVGIGDAENDHAMLALCECGVAVANALPSLKEQADLVMGRDHGAGVAELIDAMLADDLARQAPRLRRRRIPLGSAADGRELTLEPQASHVLIVGTSGSGKSVLAKGLIERVMGHGYSFVVIDPEGDYEGLPGAVTLGTSERPPSMEEAMQLFERRENVALNLIGLQLADRPSFFLKLLPELLALRNRTGQPHLVVIDEAHHLLPAASQAAEQAWPERQDGVVLITVHPDKVTPRAMKGADAVIVIGKEPAGTLGRLTQCTGQAFDVQAAEPDLEPGEALVWARGEAPVPQRLKLVPSRTEHRRHVRKYAEGELPPDRCFYFRGAEDQLNLRAQNLILFLQIADGVDDATWLHHLKRGDYSRWFAEGIKNDELAAEARRVEAMSELSPQQSRALIREAIERVYTLPA